MDLIVDRLGFNEKISILEKLPYRKKYLALKSLVHIRQLQMARNRIAHDHHLDGEDPKLKSATWLALFKDYPPSYKLAVQAARRGLSRLSNSNEFLEHFAPKRQRATNSRVRSTPEDGAAGAER